MNPHLQNGYDSSLLMHHCAICEEPLYDPHQVFADHLLCAWSHFGVIKYPAVLATNDEGKTLEGVIARPARTVLARIPHQTAISYCLGCAPKFLNIGCALCGKEIDKTKPHSRLEALEKYTSGLNRNFKIRFLHLECLPDLFSDVKGYHEKYGEVTT